MSRSKILVLVAMFLAVAAVAQAASVDEARQLYQRGEQAAAKDVLLEILALESDGAVRAEALDLLGMVAVDAGDLELATSVWEKLINDYPDSPLAVEARTKLSLATDLSKAQAEVAEAAPAEAPATPKVEAPATPDEKPVPEVAAEPAKAAPASPPESAEAAEPAAPSPGSRGSKSSVVLVAGRGKPHDGAQRAAEVIIEHLQSQGVAAESATKGVPVVEESSLVIPALVRQVDEEGANSLLLVSSNFESLAKVVAECYTPEGLLAWKKKVSGGTGWKGRPYSASGMNENLVDRMLDKLEKLVGDPCLPVSK
jgi:hypothetical protein